MFKIFFKNKKGFGLIELLVVISIIALLSTIAMVTLNDARKKARDAKRIADIKQIQLALNMYFNDKELYPITATAITLGSNDYSCLNGSGFVTSCSENPIYMKLIPPAPIPPVDNKYTYSSADGNDYQLSFTLEKINHDLGQGVNCLATSYKIACNE